MNVPSFLDTNVLVYTDDIRFPEKRERACQLFKRARLSGKGVVSLQVLQEYFVTVTKKLGVPTEPAKSKVDLFSRLVVVPFEPRDVLEAIDLKETCKISFWDALIVRAAKKFGCAVLYSEDMNVGAKLAGIEIVNPFV
jgi:predicted nucleic acid-binding protein